MRSVDPDSLRKIDLWTFKSKKSKKRYIVEVEFFEKEFLGIKFYWKGVANSKERYSLLTYDYEPRTIVMSCVMVMLNYYHKNPEYSFGFVASTSLQETNNNKIPNKRFRFYRRMMLSLFSPDNFIQGYDLNRSLYLLINRHIVRKEGLTKKQIEKEIEKIFFGNFLLTLDN